MALGPKNKEVFMRVEADGISEYDAWSGFDKHQASSGDLHKAIFSGRDVNLSFSGKNVVHNRTSSDGKVEALTLGSAGHTIIGTDARGEVSASVSWGGNEPPKVEVSASGSVSNDNNHVTVTYTVTDDGRQTVTATGGGGSDNSGDSIDNTGQDHR
jgi:hypothetical protein